MKKYLTAAALLAAGTALANAAGTLSSVWTDFSETSDFADISGGTTNDDGTVSTTNSSYATITLPNALYAGVNSWTGEMNWSIIMSFDASSLSTQTASTLFSMNVGNFSSLIGAYYTPETGTTINCNYSQTDSLSKTLPTVGTLTFVYSRLTDTNGSGELKVYGDTALLGTVTCSAVKYSSTISSIFIGGHPAPTVTSGTNKYTLTDAPSNSEVTLTAFAVYTGGVADDTAMSTYFTAANIPEPSAFGLLAGAGALALVAARRRRSK